MIFFEGTYTTTFSGNPDPTPRYDYNQIMYQLDLSDRRLTLPVAIYEVPRGRDGSIRLASKTRTAVADLETSPSPRVAFFAPKAKESRGCPFTNATIPRTVGLSRSVPQDLNRNLPPHRPSSLFCPRTSRIRRRLPYRSTSIAPTVTAAAFIQPKDQAQTRGAGRDLGFWAASGAIHHG